MFKMKMMALLKNPAIKKSLIILAAIIVAIVAIVWPKSEAGEQINVNFRAHYLTYSLIRTFQSALLRRCPKLSIYNNKHYGQKKNSLCWYVC